jgi:hypothetical protein
MARYLFFSIAPSQENDKFSLKLVQAILLVKEKMSKFGQILLTPNPGPKNNHQQPATTSSRQRRVEVGFDTSFGR